MGCEVGDSGRIEGTGKGTRDWEDLGVGKWAIGNGLGGGQVYGKGRAQRVQSQIGKSFQPFPRSLLFLTLLSRDWEIGEQGNGIRIRIGSGSGSPRMWDRAEGMVERVIRGKEDWVGLGKGRTEEEDLEVGPVVGIG